MKPASPTVCPECGGAFVERDFAPMQTLVGYSSINGHYHDDNCSKRAYYCANGHMTMIGIRRTAKCCDWKGSEECFCHPYRFVDAWPDAKDVPKIQGVEIRGVAK